MKAKVSYFKNWDSTFGVNIQLSISPEIENEFPTSAVFYRNQVCWQLVEKDGRTFSNWATLNNVPISQVNDFVESTMLELAKMVSSYYSAVVPVSHVVYFSPEDFKN